MALMRPLNEMREQMEGLLRDMEDFQLPMLTEWRQLPMRERGGRTWLPSIDLFETDTDYELRLEVPGIKPEDLDVQVLDDAVIVKGETRQEKVQDKKGAYRRECHFGSLYRRIPLPGSIKTDGIKAELKHGVLEMTLPKTTEEKGKRIPVQVK